MNDISQLLSDAGTLMLTGMVVVFVFLTLLVYLVRLLSFLAPNEPPPTLMTKPNTAKEVTSNIPPTVIAAISAAVHQHRQHK